MAKKKMQLRHHSGLSLKGRSFREIAELYSQNKVSWIEAAPSFCNAEENKQDLERLSVSYQRIRSIIAAYRLLQAQRPTFINNPGDAPLPVPNTLAYLRFIHKKARGSDKEKVFGEILDGVIDGSIKEPQIRILAKQAKNSVSVLSSPKSLVGKKCNLTSVDKSRGDADSISALDNAMKTIDYVLKSALQQNTHGQLRSLLGRRCMDLSVKLNCVGDKEFHKLWKERKEGIRV